MFLPREKLVASQSRSGSSEFLVLDLSFTAPWVSYT